MLMKTITVAKGDGVGTEIMYATSGIILATEAQIHIKEIQIGEKVYMADNNKL